MSVLKAIFRGFGACIKYINTYFKTFVFLFIIFLIFAPSSKNAVQSHNLEQIDLKGEIIDVQKVLERIKTAKEDNATKGVLFFIDSPGGAFAPSMELALAIKDLQAKKPVVVYAAGTMASGSYLAGVGANEIIANPASFIGSIGVIMQGADVSELLQKIGVKDQTIKAGAFKEAGTLTRAWSEEEKEFLQSLVDQSYNLFTNFVAKERGLKLEEAEKWANARVFLSQVAKDLRLIDELGNYEFAKERLKTLSKVEKPVYKEQDKIDKLIERLSAESALIFGKSLQNALRLGVH